MNTHSRCSTDDIHEMLNQSPSTKRKRSRSRSLSPESPSSDTDNEMKEKILIKIDYNHIYRFVTDDEKLYGNNLSISKGDLNEMYYVSPDDFVRVPFSHASCQSGALFEMVERKENNLSFSNLDFQTQHPGTGVAKELNEKLVKIIRIYYSTDLEKPFKDKISEYKATGIHVIPFDFYATETAYKYKLLNIPKLELQVPAMDRDELYARVNR